MGTGGMGTGGTGLASRVGGVLAGLQHRAGWRVLLASWVGLLVMVGVAAGLLAWLGPPPDAGSTPPLAALGTDAAGPQSTPPVAGQPELASPAAGVPRPSALSEPPEDRRGTGAGVAERGPAPPPSATDPSADGAVASAGVVPGQAAGPSAVPTAITPAPGTTSGTTPSALGLPPAPEPPPLDALAAIRPTGAAARPIPPPDPALLEPGPHGPLPRIGPEGRSAIRTYGRPFDRTDPRPRLGLVIGGLGMNAALTEEAIRRLPGAATLAFSPYARHVGPLLEQARARGMEVLVALPLEPNGHPTLNNAGDRALLTALPPAENLDRLEWALSRFAGYVGAIGALGPMRGERYAQAAEVIGVLQDTLRGRGLLYLDPRPEPRAGGGVGPRSVERAWGRAVDLVVDEPATRGEIDLKLAALERLARERGAAGALGYAGEASPVLIDRVAAWAGGVEGRGLVLAPVTAMIRRPESAAAEPVPAGGPQALRARVP